MRRSDGYSRYDATVVGPSKAEQALLWIGLPALGAGLGWLVKWGADFVVALPWAPMQGPFELVASVPDRYALIGVISIGTLAGLVFAFFCVLDIMTTTVDGSRITFKRGDEGQEVDGASVAGAFADRKELVLLGPGSEELARERMDFKAARYAAAFAAHGYKWHRSDPYADEFRRWVAGDPELSTGVHALFAARARALKASEDIDRKQLRAELNRLGVVVREVEGRQYWRVAVARRGPHPDPGYLGE